MERQGEGVQRGMEIVVSPGLGAKHLDAGIERSGHRYEQAEYGGIQRVNIVKMDNIGLTTQQFTHSVGSTHEDADSEEHEEVDIGKDINEL